MVGIYVTYRPVARDVMANIVYFASMIYNELRPLALEVLNNLPVQTSMSPLQNYPKINWCRDGPVLSHHGYRTQK